MAERTYTRRQFIIAGGAAAAAWTLPPERPAEAARVVAKTWRWRALCSSVPAPPACCPSPRPSAGCRIGRAAWAQLHSPVPAGTRLGFWDSRRHRPCARAPHRADGRPGPRRRACGSACAEPDTAILQLAAALPATRTPGTDATTEAAAQAAESALSGSPYHLRLTYHSVARLPALSAPLSVFAGAHLPLRTSACRIPTRPACVRASPPGASFPDWFTLQVSSPAAEPAL